MALISAVGVTTRHAIARALATSNLTPADATFKVEQVTIDLDQRRRVLRAEATIDILKPRHLGDWSETQLRGLVNADGEHPLMVHIQGTAAVPSFFLDIMPVTWSRWLRREEESLPPGIDLLCPKVGVRLARARTFAAAVAKRLPTTAELDLAWGSSALPWGDRADPLKGRTGAPRFGDLPEVGVHPPTPVGVFELGAWLWQWTHEGTLYGGLDLLGRPGRGVPPEDELRPVGIRLASG